MKVALVLTGLLRCYDRAYPSFKRHFLDKYDCDVHLSIWDEVGYYSGKSYQQSPSDQFVKLAEGDRGFHDSGELIDANAIMELYRPMTLDIQRFNYFEPLFDDSAKRFVNAYTRPKNSLAQAYKASRGVSLAGIVKYDMVIRARPDLVLDVDNLNFDFDPSVVYTLPSRNKMGTGTGDSLIIGSYKMVDSILLHQDHNIYGIYEKVGVSCPHIYIQESIYAHDVAHVELNIPAHIEHSPAGLYTDPT